MIRKRNYIKYAILLGAIVPFIGSPTTIHAQEETKITETMNTDIAKATQITNAEKDVYHIYKNGAEKEQLEKMIISKTKEMILNKAEEKKDKEISAIDINSNTSTTSLSTTAPLKDGAIENETIETDFELKELDSKDGLFYQYGSYIIEVKNYNEEDLETGDIELEYKPLTAMEENVVTATQDADAVSIVETFDVATETKEAKTADKIEVQMIDVTAPEISYNTDKSKEIIEGETVELTDYIESVVDDEDGEVEYELDSSEVDFNTPGEYTVGITAKDSTGNTVSDSFTITVKEKPIPREEMLQTNFYDKIAQAALSQIGVHQDCTMLVTNSLKAVGIHFHGWPIEYAKLGDWTNNPVPGDIIIYEGHVAIYVGNGQAVHGGWNGYTTVLTSVHCNNRLIGYIHVRPNI